jgi:hypothetical protein
MRSFRDTEGRTWNVQVNAAAGKRARTLTRFDLLAPNVGEVMQKMLGDMVLLVDVLYAICKPQADALKVSDEDFGEAMAGDAIEKAAEVLLAELTDFTPNARDRERARKVVQTLKEMSGQARDLVEAELDRVLAQARSISGPSSGDSPGA